MRVVVVVLKPRALSSLLFSRFIPARSLLVHINRARGGLRLDSFFLTFFLRYTRAERERHRPASATAHENEEEKSRMENTNGKKRQMVGAGRSEQERQREKPKATYKKVLLLLLVPECVRDGGNDRLKNIHERVWCVDKI